MAKTTIHSDYIPDNAITSTKIAENSIGAREIATNAITTLYVADGSVTTVKIADDAITSAKLDTNIDIAGTFDVTGATTLDAGLTVDTNTLVVDATNNRVGIGTTSPSTKLHLGGTAPLDSIIRQDSTVSGTNWEIGERVAGKWQIFEDDGDSIVATFMSTGNVGIGTSSPDSMLHLSAGSTGVSGGGSAAITMTNKFDNPDNSWIIAPVRSGVSNTGLEIRDVTDSRTDMVFDGSGNVGIGESSPDKILHLKSSGATGIAIESTTNAQNLDIDFYNNAGSAQGRIRYAEGAGSFGFAPNVSASDALHILYNGNVGIGNDNPSATLDVNGTIKLDGNYPTGSNNVALGDTAGDSLISGSIDNTLIGSQAGTAFTDADYNTAIGFSALKSDTLGSKSTAVGRGALLTQNFTSATDAHNTAVGFNAGVLVTTGVKNTFIGSLAGDATTSANENTAVGYHSLGTNQTGADNVALGAFSLFSSTASFNTSVGSSAMETNSTGYSNTAVGYQSLLSNTTGFNNLGIGQAAGGALTTGDNNICIGFEAGTHATSLQTGDNNILIGNYIDATASDTSNAIGIGYNIDAAQGYATIGINTSDIRAQHGVATWSTVSDERYKKDIADSTAGLSFINDLQPRTFKYKNLGELPESFSAYKADSTEVFKNSNTNHGFIAQEVKAVIDAHSSIKDGFRLWDEREDGSQEVAEAALIPILVKALQEADDKINNLTARIEQLEN